MFMGKPFGGLTDRTWYPSNLRWWGMESGWRIDQKSSNLWGVMPQGSRNVALFPHCWSMIPIIIIIHHTSLISTSRNIQNSTSASGFSYLCCFQKRDIVASWLRPGRRYLQNSWYTIIFPYFLSFLEDNPSTIRSTLRRNGLVKSMLNPPCLDW